MVSAMSNPPHVFGHYLRTSPRAPEPDSTAVNSAINSSLSKHPERFSCMR